VRALRGKDLGIVAWELGGTPATLSLWWGTFLGAGKWFEEPSDRWPGGGDAKVEGEDREAGDGEGAARGEDRPPGEPPPFIPSEVEALSQALALQRWSLPPGSDLPCLSDGPNKDLRGPATASGRLIARSLTDFH
jgi:hypothetical protein